MKFKTNAKCQGCVAAIGQQLNQIIAPSDWSIDLSTPEKVLTVKSGIDAGSVQNAVAKAGLKAELIES